MGTRAIRAYAQHDAELGVACSDSGELIVLVYAKLIDHLKVARSELSRGGYAIEAFTKAHDLIQQGLLTCLDYESGGEIALNLGAIYEWALKEILVSRNSRDPNKVQEVLNVITSLYEGWLELSPASAGKVMVQFSGSSVAIP